MTPDELRALLGYIDAKLEAARPNAPAYLRLEAQRTASAWRDVLEQMLLRRTK